MHKKSIGLMLLAGLLTLATPLTLSSCNGSHCSGDDGASSDDNHVGYKGNAPKSLETGTVLRAKFTEELPGVGTSAVTWTFTMESEAKATYTVERQTPFSGSGASSPCSSVCRYVKTGPDTATFTWEAKSMNTEGHDYLHVETVQLLLSFDSETSGTVPSAQFRIYDSDTGTEPTTYTAGTLELQLQ